MSSDLSKSFWQNQNSNYYEKIIKTISTELLLGIRALHFNGIIHCNLKPTNILIDEFGNVKICDFKKALRVNMSSIPNYRRSSVGVAAMKLSNDDIIDGVSIIYPDATDVIVVTKNGKFNRFNIAMLNCLSRARKGVKVIKLDATDEILNVFGVNETDKIRLLTSDGIEEIAVADVKVKSTIAAGTKMVQSKGVIVRADVIR